MKKQILLLVLVLLPVVASAYDFEKDGIYYNITSSETPRTVQVTRNPGTNGYSGSLIIPKTVTYGDQTYSVTSIGDNAFYLCFDLTSVTIPEGVTNIGDNAFDDCTGLTSIIIPEGMTSIGKWAFFCCSSLTSVTIPNSVTSIGHEAFSGCSSLRSVYITDLAAWCNISFIDSYFSNPLCYAHRLYLNGQEVKDLVIPESVKRIGDYAFYGCSNITSVTILEGVTSIGNGAFSGCSGLTSIIIPNNVTSIGGGAFYDCSSLTSVTIPGSVTGIGNGAFQNCSGLTSITIPNSVTSIGKGAFRGCSGLTSITIPSNVTSIGEMTFYGCSGLTSIIIPNRVTSIGNDAFYNCSSLTSITIPSNVRSISKYAFYNCSSLTSITIPSNVRSISKYAFYNCSSLTSITIPEDVTSIGDFAFGGCSSLKTVTLDNNNLVSAARTSYTSMTLIFGAQVETYIIRDDVESIGDYAFYGCSGLTSITIPGSVTSIGSYAFSGCSGLTTVTLESNAIVAKSRTSSTSMKSIFGNQVKTYAIDGDVDSIGDDAFYGCSGMTSVTIGHKVTSIGNNAFSNCKGLTSVIIPDNVTKIGNNAFRGCNYVKLYVNRSSDALLSVWSYGATPYDITTDATLPQPSPSALSSTQTSITYEISNLYSELEYEVEDEAIEENVFIITGLRPGYMHSIPLKVISANNSYITSTYATTSPISPTVISKYITASSLSVEGSYIEGDANVISTLLTMDGREMTNNEGYLHGLNPNTSYNCSYTVVVEYGDGEIYPYEGSFNISTAVLNLTTKQPKVISMGNAIVSAESNLDGEETNVGFEWRRTDWTDDFASNSGVAYLYEGTMEGYIRNLYTEKLWKYRPYYQSNSGNRYYGEWVGIDPTNTSYFEPTVHTYAQISVTGNRAEVKGYVMRGTDRVTSQGFIYRKNTSSYSLRKKAPSIPSDAVTVEASGNVMTAVFEDLDYETEYCYVAFVKTEENETFFGEVQTFSTNVDPDGIEEVHSSESIVHSEEAVYDLSGRQIVNGQWSNGQMSRGINIIRYADGTTRKVLIK